MEDAYVALLVLAVAAVMVIGVVGVGTTWVYLAEVRRPDVPHDPGTSVAQEEREVLPALARGSRADRDRAA